MIRRRIMWGNITEIDIAYIDKYVLDQVKKNVELSVDYLKKRNYLPIEFSVVTSSEPDGLNRIGWKAYGIYAGNPWVYVWLAIKDAIVWTINGMRWKNEKY